jgi:pimeloyl-ACP methyl ester carboxylesterase
MNPLFFGDSERPLYGVYHPPRTRDPRDHGVVLCYPVGQEYMRAHRAFRQLATLLSKSGFPVLRFDYFGTGDSSGAADAGSFDQWLKDIGTAIDELKDNAGIEHVTLVGLRLGAALAAQVQAARTDVSNVVLWDPIVIGAAYLGELIATTEAGDAARRAIADDADVVGINGFTWTRTLRAALNTVTPETFPIKANTRVALLVSGERPDYERLRERYVSLNGNFTFRCLPSPGDWAYIDAYGSALLPQDIIQGIVAHVNQETVK